jgi:hypothetical protein
MTMAKMTVNQIAEKHGLTYAQASGLTGALVQMGKMTKLDEHAPSKSANGKGKSPSLYEVPETLTLAL